MLKIDRQALKAMIGDDKTIKFVETRPNKGNMNKKTPESNNHKLISPTDLSFFAHLLIPAPKIPPIVSAIKNVA